MHRWLLLALAIAAQPAPRGAADDSLSVAFGEVDITPAVGEDQPAVWLAGYGQGRQARKVHDPLMARAVVLADGTRRVAWVSLDLVGVQYPLVEAIRRELPEIDYVLVCSTHNHEGPDVIGIWGASPLQSGVERQYLAFVRDQVVQLVQRTAAQLQPADVWYGQAADETLVRDSRLPIVKDPVLRVLSFRARGEERVLGTLVQWGCHPEAMGSKNIEVTADFPAATVESLKESTAAPVAYFTGAVGGLMAPPRDVVRDDQGQPLREGDFAYAWKYGRMVADLARRAMADARPIQATPLRFASEQIALPVDNAMYQLAWTAGVLQRPAVVWQGDPTRLDQPLPARQLNQPMAVKTELACLALGELRVACIPGEIYPELVYGGVPDPAEPGADYPDAAVEPNVQQLLGAEKWLIFGLANDEIGYIIPKRQWDQKPPFCYGRSSSQYGEINSCSPQAAEVIMAALGRVVKSLEAAQ